MALPQKRARKKKCLPGAWLEPQEQWAALCCLPDLNCGRWLSAGVKAVWLSVSKSRVLESLGVRVSESFSGRLRASMNEQKRHEDLGTRQLMGVILFLTYLVQVHATVVVGVINHFVHWFCIKWHLSSGDHIFRWCNVRDLGRYLAARSLPYPVGENLFCVIFQSGRMKKKIACRFRSPRFFCIFLSHLRCFQSTHDLGAGCLIFRFIFWLIHLPTQYDANAHDKCCSNGGRCDCYWCGNPIRGWTKNKSRVSLMQKLHCRGKDRNKKKKIHWGVKIFSLFLNLNTSKVFVQRRLLFVTKVKTSGLLAWNSNITCCVSCNLHICFVERRGDCFWKTNTVRMAA